MKNYKLISVLLMFAFLLNGCAFFGGLNGQIMPISSSTYTESIKPFIDMAYPMIKSQLSEKDRQNIDEIIATLDEQTASESTVDVFPIIVKLIIPFLESALAGNLTKEQQDIADNAISTLSVKYPILKSKNIISTKNLKK